MEDNKYSRGKIYRLVNSFDNEVYVGSTIQPLAARKGGHKRKAVLHPNRFVYQHLNNIGWDNVDIILIENYHCNTKEELNARERYWIEELKPTLNIQLPTRTQQEYREHNVEYIKERDRIYRQQNAETIKQKKREYRQQNKDAILAHQREFYQQNKDVINARRREARAKKKAQQQTS